MSLRRGAWVYFAALFIGLGLLYWQLQRRVVEARRARETELARDHIEGFDLSFRLIPKNDVVPCGAARDGLAVFDHPVYLDETGLDSLNAIGRDPFLLPRDRVIGIELGGQARAYPLAILDWHELVNDSLAGTAFLVSWHPLSGSAAVYDREIGGERRAFGFSGLLYASGSLLYDRTEAPSLWSQLTGRAVTGPAAADSLALRRLPLDLCRWGDWRQRHPESLVLAPEAGGMLRKYRRRPYNSYDGNDLLQFPVRRLPPADGLPLKTPVLAVWAGGKRRLYPLPLVATRAGAAGRWDCFQAEQALEFRVSEDPLTVTVQADGSPVPSAQAFWFEWYAQDPAPAEQELVQ